MTGMLRHLAAAGAGAAPPAIAIAALGAALWMLHLLRLRRRERQLLAIIERMTRERAGTAAAAAAVPGPTRAALEGGGREPARVIVCAPRDAQQALARQLVALKVDFGLADSAWSALVACREAREAGEPYNLVLAEATVPEAAEPEGLAGFEAALAVWGVGVAVVRGHAGGEAAGSMARRGLAFALSGDGGGVRGDAGLWPEEGIGPDENPDRGGRSRFAAAVAADASAVGLRSRRGE